MEKPIPEDTGSFLAIRTANPQMRYVDKTAYLHRMVTSGAVALACDGILTRHGDLYRRYFPALKVIEP